MPTVVHSWVSSSTRRLYPETRPPRKAVERTLDVAQNERFSFQVAVRHAGADPVQVHAEIQAPYGWAIRVRTVGYVPVRHLNLPIPPSQRDCEGMGHVPGYVPDPLFHEQSLLLPPRETHAFWVTGQPGGEVKPGTYELTVTVRSARGEPRTHRIPVRVHTLVLKPRSAFSVTHWFYADALIDWYRTDLFDHRFWRFLVAYVRNMVEHEQDTLLVPVFTPPLDGVKRPTQLLRVTRTGKDRYRFDWQDVRRYIRTARRCGIRNFEWCPFFTQWGAQYAIRIYEGQGRAERLLWPPETSATSPTYRRFLAQFLPALHDFLCAEKILRVSFFHVSDEPHGETHRINYKKARGMLAELAPWMKVMDALSEIGYGREALTDMPIAIIHKALDFARERIPSWCYYCCEPRGPFLNRLLDTPLAKIAMHGFLFYRWPFRGFLNWGYNYWYRSQTRQLIDPFTVQDGAVWPKWPYGDPFVVYPGPEGPLDSIRWEVLAEGLQDYRLLQTSGIPRNGLLLRAIQSFADFPKTEQWRQQARAAIFRFVEKQASGT